ncbi:RNA 2',3'-cyclic phosphodiesterase [Candidatus Woesearchaeota archaeon]|nr:RNA 2',3'-cyclic phosphodiesterase [Candidatus Woesearchaeota archaeon]
MKRFFVGIPVSEEIKVKIKPLLEQLKATGGDFNVVSLENLHFTVKFLGDVDEEKIPEIVRRLKTIPAKKFTLSVEGVSAFPSLERINSIWAGTKNGELATLMKSINSLLDYIRREEHEEIPHLTLARMKSARKKMEVQEILKALERAEFGQMAVEQFILYESQLTPLGPIYTVMEKFELG